MSNELKIELYPENMPISELEKKPVETIINKETLVYSFNQNQKLAYFCYKVPTLSGLYTAYCNHYPIRIKPDDIWLLIVQCFSHHVNANSKKLRKYFVDFEGKKNLEINIECLEIEKENIENFVEQINQELKKYLGNEVLENLTPDFTTTDINTKLVCQISIMDTFKQYFNYYFNQLNCGIPYIILEGEAEDYKKIILKAKNLSKYHFGWYINRIIPIIQKMVEAKEGNIDINFFKNIILKEEVTRTGIRDCEYNKYKIKYINGWIVKFFGYIKRDDILCQFSEDKIEGEEINNLPSQILNVPFTIKNMEDKSEKKMKFEAGIFGCEQNEKKEMSLGIGWLVSPSNTSEKGKNDIQFENEHVPFDLNEHDPFDLNKHVPFDLLKELQLKHEENNLTDNIKKRLFSY